MARSNFLALLVLAIATTGALAQTNKTVQWVVPANGQSYSETIPVGGSITFQWTSRHDLWETPSSACPTTFTNGSGLTQLAPASNGGSRVVNFTTAGTRYFACSVSSHCTEGQHITVRVGSSGPAPAPGPNSYGRSGYGGGTGGGGPSTSGSGYGGSSGSGSNYNGNSTYGGSQASAPASSTTTSTPGSSSYGGGGANYGGGSSSNYGSGSGRKLFAAVH